MARLAASIASTMRSANSSVVSVSFSFTVVMDETLGRRGCGPHQANHANSGSRCGANYAEACYSKLFPCAHATAAVREETPSLAYMLARCLPTVFSLMQTCSA